MPTTPRAHKRPRKDLVLFIVNVPEDGAYAVHALRKGKDKLSVAVIVDSRKPTQRKQEKKEWVDIMVAADLSSPSDITRALLPYRDRLLAVTCRGEYNIGAFQHIIPHVPYLRTPTVESLKWSTNKLEMRKRFFAFDKSITPKFAIVHDASRASIAKIVKRVRFPMVLKPAGLAASLLVTLCYHQADLDKALKNAFRKIRKLYREQGSQGEPQLLVEEFMEGGMYSIDSYVTSRGRVSHCPIVHIKTGHAVGFDDFFGYIRTTPTTLSKTAVEAAQAVATKAVYALGLRNCTVHIELMRTEEGWKVIEAGPRIGGNRVLMYQLSYGFDHAQNDILVRIPKKLHIATRAKAHTAVIYIYPKKEGVIVKIKGVKKVAELASYHAITKSKKVGDVSRFSKHGGKAVLTITLCNKDRSDLLADIRRLEQMVAIETRRG